MNRDTRIESYRKIYAHLKEVKGLTNFEYSDEQKNLEFQFDGGPFHFWCGIKKVDSLFSRIS